MQPHENFGSLGTFERLIIKQDKKRMQTNTTDAYALNEKAYAGF